MGPDVRTCQFPAINTESLLKMIVVPSQGERVTPPDARYYRVLAGPSRAELLRVLRHASKPLTIPELAELTGLHENTVRGHLDILTSAGYVQRQKQPRHERGRPRHSYTTTAVGSIDPDLPASEFDPLRMLTRILADQVAHAAPDVSDWTEAAAEDWMLHHNPNPGHRVVTTEDEALDVVAGVLAGRGQPPVVDREVSSVTLRACPYADVAQEQQQVVCAAHLGMVNGVLASMQSPFEAHFLSIDPQTPHCVIQLAENPR